MSIPGQNGPHPFPMVMEPDLSGTKFLERTTGSTAPLCPSDKMGSTDHHWENNNGIFRKSSLSDTIIGRTFIERKKIHHLSDPHLNISKCQSPAVLTHARACMF